MKEIKNNTDDKLIVRLFQISGKSKFIKYSKTTTEFCQLGSLAFSRQHQV